MSLRFIDGFDHLASGDLTEKYHALDGATIRAAQGRRGTACLAIGGLQWVSLTLDPQARWVVGFALRFASIATGSQAAGVMDVSAFGAPQLGLQVTPEGFVRALRGSAPGTVLGQSLQAMHAHVYYYVEALFVVHPSAGEVVVRVDGVDWLHLTGVNTEATASVLPNQVRLGTSTIYGLNDGCVDDLYICDGQGSGTFTTFLGDCRVDALRPNADGTYTAWTPSAGAAHYTTVDEPMPNDDTDYVSETTASGRDSYQLAPLPTMPNPEVLAVQALVSARKEDVDEILIAPLLVSGAVTAVASTPQALTASYLYARELWTADPNGGGAWTAAAVNSLQVGVERL